MKLERLIAIVMLLLTREKVSGKQLAELFEVSLRTIYRDVEAINRAGIPIVTTPGPNGGIGIMKEYKVEKGIFTTADIVAMLMGLGCISSTLSSQETASTLAKVQSFIPEAQRHEVVLKANQIAIDLSPWMGSNLTAKIGMVRSALDSRRLVSFLYRNRQGETALRTMEPHRLLFKGDHWYVHGYCRGKKDFRLFKLSRMSDIEIQPDTFAPRTVPPAISEFTQNMAQNMIDVELLVHSSILDRVLDYCSERDISSAHDGLYRVHFNFVPDDYGYGILMSFGSRCVCTGPPHVRRELCSRLRQAAEAYKD